jgi:diguanylate cyclase (GGDEF)-like protein
MKKILIIDDEIANIKLLHSALSDSYQVLAAKSGQDGISTALQQQPDLILLDIIMPIMSGYDVFEQLKETPDTKNIPIIYITGIDNNDDEEYGLKQGARDYITKPFHLSVVKARVTNQIQILEQQKTIQYLANHDTLTSIPNRLYIQQLLTDALTQQPNVCVIFLDLDKFKAINDNYGHAAGDAVLKEVAIRLNQALTSLQYHQPSHIGRMGGDEFLMIIPNVIDNSSVEQLCVKLHEAIQQEITFEGHSLFISGSLGAVLCDPQQSPDEVTRTSDKLMYKAKANPSKRYYINRTPPR